jgi:carbon starvation protein
MNSLWIIILSVLTTGLQPVRPAHRLECHSARRQASTAARMYMDGVDFMPTNRNMLFRHHFKAIAAAGYAGC